MSRRVVWKYSIPIRNTVTTHQIPEGARLLHCAAQGADISLWFEVAVSETRTQERSFRVFSTGDPSIDDHLSYVGSGMFEGGRFVFHVYEVEYP